MTILLVEGDAELHQSLAGLLSSAGVVAAVSNARECRERLARSTFDLAVLDLNLPDDSGFAMVRYLRRTTRTRIIVHTHRDTLTDRVEAYTQGADLFLVKPAPEAEMLAAVKSLLGREQPSPEAEPGGWLLDKGGGLRGPGGETIRLGHRQIAFMKCLARTPGQPVGRDELRRAIGIEETDESGRALDMFVRRLRNSIEEQAHQKAPITTIYRQGFAFDPASSQATAQAD
ncbi:response regulator transcription factor [Methylocystis sp. IM3]|uniref:response regulator transcription factor n=2 Tax=Methylocystis TaxID=133 RepID=UPI0031192AC0